MNKIIKSIGVLSLGAMLLVSCERTDDLATLEITSQVAKANVSTQNIVLDPEKTDDIALTIQWTQTEYKSTAPLGNELEYVVEISSDEKFISPRRISTLSKDVKEISFSVEKLNGDILALGYQKSVSKPVYFRVVSLLGQAIIEATNIIKIDITPYGPDYNYQDWYLVGNATAAGWNEKDYDNLLPLLKDVQALNKYTFTGYFKQGEFKLLKEKGKWEGNYGGSEGRLVSGGGNIAIPADGYYTLTFDFEAETYTITSIATPTTTYETVGIIGTATANGWDASTAMKKSSFNPHLWILYGVKLSKGELKFRADNSWNVNWGGTGVFFGTATQDGQNIKVETTYKYNIYFNDATGDYSIIPTE